jgi:hypothetical protein
MEEPEGRATRPQPKQSRYSWISSRREISPPPHSSQTRASDSSSSAQYAHAAQCHVVKGDTSSSMDQVNASTLHFGHR